MLKDNNFYYCITHRRPNFFCCVTLRQQAVRVRVLPRGTTYSCPKNQVGRLIRGAFEMAKTSLLGGLDRHAATRIVSKLGTGIVWVVFFVAVGGCFFRGCPGPLFCRLGAGGEGFHDKESGVSFGSLAKYCSSCSQLSIETSHSTEWLAVSNYASFF